MANPNPDMSGIKSFADRSPEERSEIARMGQAAGLEVKRKKKSLRLALEALLESTQTIDGVQMTGTEAACVKLFEKVLKGDVKAFETLRATVGQDPVQKVMVADVDQATIEEVEAAVMGE